MSTKEISRSLLWKWGKRIVAPTWAVWLAFRAVVNVPDDLDRAKGLGPILADIGLWDVIIAPNGPLMLIVAIGLALWAWDVPAKATAKLKGASPEENQKRSAAAVERMKDIGAQVKRLSSFELFALVRLLENRRMTGPDLATIAHELGIPVEMRVTEEAIEKTFERIAQRASILAQDPTTKDWSINEADRPYMEYLLKRTAPHLG